MDLHIEIGRHLMWAIIALAIAYAMGAGVRKIIVTGGKHDAT
jgi:hypothetical protein